MQQLTFVELQNLLKQLQDVLKDPELSKQERATVLHEIRKVQQEIDKRRHD